MLSGREPAPLAVENRWGRSAFVILCEHAANRIPKKLENLGLKQGDLKRHIAWDIGALALGRLLSERLDAPLLYQRYSRLVFDCNRRLTHESLIAVESDGTTIPGNTNLSPGQRRWRIDQIYTPYQRGVAQFLDDRIGKKMPTILIMLHSFTPRMGGVSRPWDVGLLYNRHVDSADIVIDSLARQDPGLIIGRNQPYRIELDEDFTLPEFGENRHLPHIFLEVRQDHIKSTPGQQKWVGYLARACKCLSEPGTGIREV